MRNIHQFPDGDQVFNQASQWIAKLDRGLNTDEQTQFKAWLEANDQHKNVLLDMAKLWDKMDALDRLADLFPISKKATTKVSSWHVSLAASVVLAFFAGIWSYSGLDNLFIESDRVVHNINYETAVGENNTFYLPDNTKVLLNTNSLLEVTYTESYRLLELKRGELNVDVAHDKSRPLSVVANNRIIQAVGTAFNVKVDFDEIELIVTDGKVLVGQLDSDEPKIQKSLNIPASSLAVTKGEIASLGVNTNKLKKIDPKAIKVNLSWRQGNLVFNGESLEEAMAEVSRYTSVKFKIADEELKYIKIAGRFKTGDVVGLIGALNNNFNIKTDRVNKNLVILREQ